MSFSVWSFPKKINGAPTYHTAKEQLLSPFKRLFVPISHTSRWHTSTRPCVNTCRGIITALLQRECSSSVVRSYFTLHHVCQYNLYYN